MVKLRMRSRSSRVSAATVLHQATWCNERCRDLLRILCDREMGGRPREAREPPNAQTLLQRDGTWIDKSSDERCRQRKRQALGFFGWWSAIFGLRANGIPKPSSIPKSDHQRKRQPLDSKRPSSNAKMRRQVTPDFVSRVDRVVVRVAVGKHRKVRVFKDFHCRGWRGALCQ